MIKSFILLLQFFTTLPVPISIEYNEKNFSQAIIFIPVIGLIIGFFLAAVYFLTSLLHLRLLSALVTVTALVILSGGLHLDGLADTFDGIFSCRSPEKILEIMKDPRIGTYGVLSLLILLLFKITLLYSLADQSIYKILIFLPFISRTALIWNCGLSPYAGKSQTVASIIVNHCRGRQIIGVTGLALLLFLVFFDFISILAFVLIVLFTFLYTSFIKNKLHGITGDTIGALVEINEVLYLFFYLVINQSGLLHQLLIF